MSRVPAVLAALAGLPLGLVHLRQSTDLVPLWLPIALVIAGSVLAAVAALARRPRIHGIGLALALAGAGLTGPSIDTGTLLLGSFGAVLAVAALGLAIEMPKEGRGHAKLVPVTLVLAGLTALAGTGLALLLGDLGGGGVDARAGVTAWIALAVVISWALVRRAVRGESA